MLCPRSDTDANAHSKSNGDSDPDTMHGKMWTDTASAPDTAPAAVTFDDRFLC